jgi:NAD(P)-dependent dehydrogenase (short-subunit alcohol dehydrogenase family)
MHTVSEKSMVNPEYSDRVNLTGQVALLTGGGRGLGRVFAQVITGAGAKIAITARTESQLLETAKLIEDAGGTVIPFVADVTDMPAMQRVIDETVRRLGPIDILVNNAAVLTPIAFDWEVDPDEWWRTFEVNVRSAFRVTLAVLPGMMARRRGRIVNVSSGAAHTVHPYATAYCTAKAALTVWTNQLAAGVLKHGISVFALSPEGASDMAGILAISPVVGEQMNAYFQNVMAQSSNLASSVAALMFMLSGEADALTGRQISWWNTPEDLKHRCDEILRDDLLTLRLRYKGANALIHPLLIARSMEEQCCETFISSI